MTNLCVTTREGVAVDCGADVKSVLLVDDDQSFLFSLLRRVKHMHEDLNIYTAANGKQARAILNTVPIDLVISDVAMPVMDGLELVNWLAEAKPQVTAILMGSRDEPGTNAAIAGKGYTYLQKPLDVRDLARVIEPLLMGR